jgi:hypothetical protein
VSGARYRVVALLVLLLGVGACAVPRWPLEGPVTSPYGVRVRGAILPSVHRGVDIGVPDGTPVHTMTRGRVRFAGTMSGYGQVVWIDHGTDLLTVYAHLSRIDVTARRRGEGPPGHRFEWPEWERDRPPPPL